MSGNCEFSSIYNASDQTDVKDILSAISDFITTSHEEGSVSKVTALNKIQSLTKKSLGQPKDPQDEAIIPLPEEMHTGKLSIDNVRRIAAQLSIPISMVCRVDPFEPDSYAYIANFWHYSNQSIYYKLIEVGVTPHTSTKTDAYATFDYKLDLLPMVYNKLQYKPHYVKSSVLSEMYKELVYERPKSVDLDIMDEDDNTNDPVSKDLQFTDWFPFLVLTHSSVKYHPGMLKNSIVRDSDDDIDWYSTIQSFIDLAMKFRLSRSTKLNEFKNLIRGNAKECVFSMGNITLPQLYKKMIAHGQTMTAKEKHVKRLFKFVRHIGQSLVESLETIFEFYKGALYPNTEVSLNPNHVNFNLACAEYMANCLYSLTTPDIALQIIKHNAAILANGQRINVIQCARAAGKIEKAGGVPLSTRPLYITKNPADIANTARTVKDFSGAPIVSFNYMDKYVNSNATSYEDELETFIQERDKRYKNHSLHSPGKPIQPIGNPDVHTTVRFDTDTTIQKIGIDDTIQQNPPIPMPYAGLTTSTPSKNPLPANTSHSPNLSTIQQGVLPAGAPSPSAINQLSFNESPLGGLDQSQPPPQTTPASSPVQSPSKDSVSSSSTTSGNLDPTKILMNIKIDEIKSIKDPWAKAMAVLKVIRGTTKKNFDFENIFYNGISDNQKNKITEQFDLSEQFFNLGADIFKVIGYPNAPVSYDMKGIKKIFIKLNELQDVPLFYKNIFFNCPSMMPIFGSVTPLINDVCGLLKNQWMEDNVPINNIALTKLNSIIPQGDRSLSRGRIESGKYVSNFPNPQSSSNNQGGTYREKSVERRPRYDSESNRFGNNRGSRNASRSPGRNRRGYSPSPFVGTRDSRMYHGSNDATSYVKQSTDVNIPNIKLELRCPYYKDLQCYPYTCEGKCEGKRCKKCGGLHPSHSCGYYLHLSPTPCTQCPELFHNVTECQNKAVTFPEPSKN